MTAKYAALASTALISISASAALANGNEVFLIQNGGSNQALVAQDGASDSALGVGGLSAQQVGNANQLLLTQIGATNTVGQEGSGFVQVGDTNLADITQRGADNTIGSVEQFGNGNRYVAFSNVDGNNNRVASVLQDSTGSASFNQLHYGIHGNNNGQGTFTGDAASIGLGDSTFVQTGGYNNIDLQVTGDNNLVSGSQVGTGSNMFYYWVNGNDNQTALSIEASAGNNILGLTVDGGTGNNIGMRMRTTGNIGNYAAFYTTGGASFNTMFADQLGDENTIVANSYGSYNDVDIVQLGLNNETRNEMYSGDNMTLNILQDGADNTFFSVIDAPTGANAVFMAQQGNANNATLDLYGDGNNTLGTPLVNGASLADTPLFTGLAASTGLSAGALSQSGTGNTMDVNIGTSAIASNNNLFAVVQTGMNNYAELNITGDNNQAAISQSGDFNVAQLTQIGNGNIAGILQ